MVAVGMGSFGLYKEEDHEEEIGQLHEERKHIVKLRDYGLILQYLRKVILHF